MAYEERRREPNWSANKRFNEACRAEGLSKRDIDWFSEEMHNDKLNEEGMSYKEIRELIQDWKDKHNWYHV